MFNYYCQMSNILIQIPSASSEIGSFHVTAYQATKVLDIFGLGLNRTPSAG